jgi:hypothetical protein
MVVQTGIFFWVMMQQQFSPRIPTVVRFSAETALKAYSEPSERGRPQKRTDLMELASRREDSDVSVVSHSRRRTHCDEQ